MGNMLKTYLLRSLRELTKLKPETLMEQRYQKFRKMGVYEELAVEAADAAS